MQIKIFVSNIGKTSRIGFICLQTTQDFKFNQLDSSNEILILVV